MTSTLKKKLAAALAQPGGRRASAWLARKQSGHPTYRRSAVGRDLQTRTCTPTEHLCFDDPSGGGTTSMARGQSCTSATGQASTRAPQRGFRSQDEDTATESR